MKKAAIIILLVCLSTSLCKAANSLCKAVANSTSLCKATTDDARLCQAVTIYHREKSDTTTEQQFVDFLAGLPFPQSVEESRTMVDSLTEAARASREQTDFLLDWAAKYLLDRRSPLYNPTEYDSLFVMDMEGREVLDFNFEDSIGNKLSLYGSAIADTTVLFFYSADCDHCQSLLRKWQQSPSTLPSLLSRHHVIAVCLNSDDKDLWLKSIPLLPQAWQPVLDLDRLIARRRYDLRTLPHAVVVDGKFKSLKSIHFCQ